MADCVPPPPSPINSFSPRKMRRNNGGARSVKARETATCNMPVIQWKHVVLCQTVWRWAAGGRSRLLSAFQRFCTSPLLPSLLPFVPVTRARVCASRFGSIVARRIPRELGGSRKEALECASTGKELRWAKRPRAMTMIHYTVVTIDLTAPKVRHYGKIESEPTIGPRINSIFPL